MSQKGLRNGKAKDNSNKSGAAIANKERKRAEAEERNEAYQKLSIEKKLEHHKEGGKAWSKLMAQKTKQELQNKTVEDKKNK